MWVNTATHLSTVTFNQPPYIHTILFRRHVATIVILTSEGSYVTIADNGANIREQWRCKQAFGLVPVFLYFASFTEIRVRGKVMIINRKEATTKQRGIKIWSIKFTGSWCYGRCDVTRRYILVISLFFPLFLDVTLLHSPLFHNAK
jgi:hypothetical protein